MTDQLALRNPQSVAEFAQDIFLAMRENEESYMVAPDYLEKMGSDIKDTSRAFLIEWVIDVQRKFRLLPETLFLAVVICDRYLASQKSRKSDLHLIGVTSILISTKYEEIYPPEMNELLSVSENKFRKAELLVMEFKMLSALDFDFTQPSIYRFLERFRKISILQSDEQAFFFAQYISEICLLDTYLLKYRPSEVAAASLILSGGVTKNNRMIWNKEMEKITGMKLESLYKVIEDVRDFAMEVNPKFLQTLKYKFSKPQYHEVAQLTMKFTF